MGVLQLLAKENYIAYNKIIASIVGVDEAILFGELCSMCNLYGVEFFCEQSKLIENTCLTEYRVRNALKNLEGAGLLKIVKKGLPAKNYYTLQEDVLMNVLNFHRTSGTKFDTTGGCKIDTTDDMRIEHISIIRKNRRSKNIKNSRKESETDNSFVRIIGDYAKGNADIIELLLEWVKVRKAKRAAMTARAIELNIQKLDRLAEESHLSVSEYLKEVIARGWSAFYAIPTYGTAKRQDEERRYGCFDPDEAFKNAMMRTYGENGTGVQEDEK